MNTSFERSAKATDEWYTPIGIIQALGEFDLDPCVQCFLFGQRQKTCITRMMTNWQKNGLVEYG